MRATWTELGKIAGCSGQHIGQVARRKGYKLDKDGRVDAEHVLSSLGKRAAWLRYYENKPEVKDETEPDYELERARKERALRQLREMEVKEREGVLLKRTEVEKLLVKMITTAKTRLLVLPSRLSPQLAIETETPVCEEIIENGIREALDELSRNPAANLSKPGQSLETA